MVLETVKKLKPKNLLDVGCRHGESTFKLKDHSVHIIGIDINSEHIEKATKEYSADNIEYCEMDARKLQFENSQFEVVIERYSLHHIKHWYKALDEMIRVSSKYILIEEPLDDFRSEAKVNAYLGNHLFLELQREANFSHFDFLNPELIVGYLKVRGLKAEYDIEKSETIYEFDEFIYDFEEFAEMTDRKEYWMNRLDDFRLEMQGKKFCGSDKLNIIAIK